MKKLFAAVSVLLVAAAFTTSIGCQKKAAEQTTAPASTEQAAPQATTAAPAETTQAPAAK